MYSGDEIYDDEVTSGLSALERGVRLADDLASDPAFGRNPDLIAAEVVRQIPELAADYPSPGDLAAERDPGIITESELRLLDGNR